MPELEYGDYGCSGKSVLLCPNCGFDCLHHFSIEAFERGEDETTGLHIVIRGETVDIKHDGLEGNPSPRRHGLKIGFWCEGCNANLMMSVFQHKGNTFVGWDIT